MPASMIVAVAFMAAASIAKGMAEKQDAEFEKKQFEEQGQAIALQGVQDENRARENARRLMATARASAASRHIGIFGDGRLAAERADMEELEREALTIKVNTDTGVRKARLGAEQASARGKGAMIQGVLGAGSSIAQGVDSGAFKGS